MIQPMPTRYAVKPTKSFSSAPEEPKFISVHISKDWTMNNPVVLITGALTGIGRATALAFAKAGARLVVAGRREDALRQTAALWKGDPAMLWRQADVADRSSVSDLFGGMDLLAGTKLVRCPL